MGSTEGTLLKLAERMRGPIPDKIQKAPELQVGLELFLEAFQVLTTCRGAMYGSEGPIPWTAMREYCNEYGIEGEERDYFYEVISHMDNTYLNFKATKMSKKPASGGMNGNA